MAILYHQRSQTVHIKPDQRTLPQGLWPDWIQCPTLLQGLQKSLWLTVQSLHREVGSREEAWGRGQGRGRNRCPWESGLGSPGCREGVGRGTWGLDLCKAGLPEQIVVGGGGPSRRRGGVHRMALSPASMEDRGALKHLKTFFKGNTVDIIVIKTSSFQMKYVRWFIGDQSMSTSSVYFYLKRKDIG